MSADQQTAKRVLPRDCPRCGTTILDNDAYERFVQQCADLGYRALIHTAFSHGAYEVGAVRRCTNEQHATPGDEDEHEYVALSVDMDYSWALPLVFDEVVRRLREGCTNTESVAYEVTIDREWARQIRYTSPSRTNH